MRPFYGKNECTNSSMLRITLVTWKINIPTRNKHFIPNCHIYLRVYLEIQYISLNSLYVNFNITKDSESFKVLRVSPI